LTTHGKEFSEILQHLHISQANMWCQKMTLHLVILNRNPLLNPR